MGALGCQKSWRGLGGRGAWLLGCSTDAVYGRTKYFREVPEVTKMPPSPRVCCR